MTVVWVLLAMAAIAIAIVFSMANNLVEFGVHMRKSIQPESLEKPGFTIPDYYKDNVYHQRAHAWIVAQQPEDVSIVSHDGLKLRGLYFQHPDAQDAALVLPGWTDIKEFLYPEVKLMYDAGLSVLMPDQRAHGTSEGEYSTFGYNEAKDANGWKAVLKQKGAQRIVLYGRSMGAATAMMTACLYPEDVRCAVEDAGFTSMLDEVNSFVSSRARWVPPFLYPLLTWISDPIIKSRAGYNMADASPISLLPECTVPMMFIHGMDDTFIPYDMMPDLYDAHPGPKEQYSVEGAGHVQSLPVGGEEYANRVHSFIRKYL